MFVGAVAGFGTPLRPVQLLWVNLIMDSFGALALATEPPTPELLERAPYGRHDSLVSPTMRRNILVQAAYQFTVEMVLLFVAPKWFYRCANGSCAPLSVGAGFESKVSEDYAYTMIFNAFVWCQIFNEINSRFIGNGPHHPLSRSLTPPPAEVNMFRGLHKNPMFIAIWLFTIAIQIVIVQLTGRVFSVVPLEFDDWIICIAIGSVSLILGWRSRRQTDLDRRCAAVHPHVHAEGQGPPAAHRKDAITAG